MVKLYNKFIVKLTLKFQDLVTGYQVEALNKLRLGFEALKFYNKFIVKLNVYI